MNHAGRSQAPTEVELRALYKAADALYALAPWKWMYDSHIFGVRDPEQGTVGYCCVMGNLGEHYALAVYLGDAGLRGYRRIASGEFQRAGTQLGAMFVQHCLMASYEDRTTLDQAERDQIKALGLKYRGRNNWPQFRLYEPGFFPWYLSGAEMRFLTTAIEQVCEVAPRFSLKTRPTDLRGPEPVLVRAYSDGVWLDTYHTPNLAPPPDQEAAPVDAARVQQIRQRKLAQGGAWEIGHFYLPQPIQDKPGQRPYYPVSCLAVDARTGMILTPHLTQASRLAAELQVALIQAIERAGAIPKELAVRGAEDQRLLAPIAQELGVKLRVAKRLPMLEEAQRSMMSFMGR